MLRGLWTYFLLVVATLAFGLPATLVSLLRRETDFTMNMGRRWSRVMLWASGGRVRYHDAKHMAAALPCVYISNHASNLDIWALFGILPPAARFVAKQSLFRVPVLGWALATSGFIPIDRGHRKRALRSLQLAAEKIRGGRSVILFAEGTRSRSGRLGEFKKGPFHLALRARAPVVPIAISGSFRVLPPGALRVRPGPVDVRVFPPIDVAPFLPADVDGLRARVRAVIERGLEPADGAARERLHADAP